MQVSPMWAKRFPVPEFDRHSLKDLSWKAPEIQAGLNSGDFGCVAVDADSALYEKFSFRGDNLMAVACSLPDCEVTVSGNSFAWPIQRAVLLDSLDAKHCRVIADWKTPRPMNTRFGPDGGFKINATEVYALIGHSFADEWVANRIMLDNDWSGDTGNGYRILSSSESEINDFHDAVIYFEWQ